VDLDATHCHRFQVPDLRLVDNAAGDNKKRPCINCWQPVEWCSTQNTRVHSATRNTRCLPTDPNSPFAFALPEEGAVSPRGGGIPLPRHRLF
jgi:hypothetical protein